VIVPGVTYNGTLSCNSFFSNAGNVINNGIPVVFIANDLFPTGTTITNIVGNTITLSNPAATPLPGLSAGAPSTNLPLTFVSTPTATPVLSNLGIALFAILLVTVALRELLRTLQLQRE
jgi:hypothetical protein